MRILTFQLLLFTVFLLYQTLAFAWKAPAFDPFFPLFLGGLFWRLGKFPLFLSLIFWGSVLDAYSSLVPGPSVLAYLVSLFFFWQLKRRLALRGFFPALLSLVFSLSLCEWLRLYLWPRFFELSLPPLSFYFVGKIMIGTLVWGLFCWLFCQFSFMRDLFEIPASSES